MSVVCGGVSANGQFSAESVRDEDRSLWAELLIGAINGSYRQTFAVEEARRFRGWKNHAFFFHRNGTRVAGVHYSVKELPLGLGRIAHVDSGFVFCRRPDAHLLSFLIEHFLKWAKEREATIVRLTPWLPKTIGGKLTEYASWVPRVIENAGFVEKEPGRHTYWIDLTQDEDQLLAKMHKQTRYNIRRAERRGLEVEVCQEPNPEFLNIFFELGDRHDNQKNLTDFLEHDMLMAEIVPMLESKQALFFAARHGGKIRSITFASCFGEAASLHSAMDPDVSNDKSCPPPGHKVRWEVIRTCKSMGLRVHDMGFCPGAVPQKGSRYGIWYFKWSFGGDHVEFLPVYTRTLRPISGIMVKAMGRLLGKKI